MVHLQKYTLYAALLATCMHSFFSMELQQSIGTQPSQSPMLETLAGKTIESLQRHINHLQSRLDLMDAQKECSRKITSALAKDYNSLLTDLIVERKVTAEQANITRAREKRKHHQINNLYILLAIQAQELTNCRTELSTRTFDQQEPSSKTDWHAKKFARRRAHKK